MATEAVLKYLVDTNRPYSCADVTVNLRGAYTKSVVQKTLDALSESGKIKCKLYGKQKVYAAIQQDNDEDDGDMAHYDTKLKSLAESLLEKNKSLKESQTNLKNITSTLPNDSIKTEIDSLTQRLKVQENKLGTLRTSVAVVSADEKKAILAEHDKFLSEYRKRKRMCTDMLEAVLEGYPKSKKTLLEELCVETDEMVNFKLSTNT